MVAIKDQLHDVLFGHFGQLPGEDVLEIEEELERLVIAVVPNDLEGDFMLFLLGFGGIVPGGKPQADVLP